MMRAFRCAVASSALQLAACAGPAQPAVAEPSHSTEVPAVASSASSADPMPAPAPPADAEAVPTAAPPPSAKPAPSVAEPVAPALHDAEGKPLPQTEDRPSATSPAFLRRMELLVRAIEADDATLAHEAFFPVVAYEQVKDIAKPALDHERRLLTAFARNVHEYHRELGKDASGLRFVRVELPEDKVKWMKVGSEGNRVGYFRVLRSRLVVATGSDKERSFELTSMISWRGEWYVVHLHGFK